MRGHPRRGQPPPPPRPLPLPVPGDNLVVIAVQPGPRRWRIWLRGASGRIAGTYIVDLEFWVPDPEREP